MSGKAYYRAFFVNFLTACTFVLYAFTLHLQGFSWDSVPSWTYSQQIEFNRFCFCESNGDESFIPNEKLELSLDKILAASHQFNLFFTICFYCLLCSINEAPFQTKG